ncbi:hypothetical protein AB0G85_36185 [Streptomyces sioyaensis]|uniref:hypothetical protein n=1 Tax=Streptomyces sioyaensis TaxID=67364 RepID=UPI0033E2371C
MRADKAAALMKGSRPVTACTVREERQVPGLMLAERTLSASRKTDGLPELLKLSCPLKILLRM